MSTGPTRTPSKTDPYIIVVVGDDGITRAVGTARSRGDALDTVRQLRQTCDGRVEVLPRAEALRLLLAGERVQSGGKVRR